MRGTAVLGALSIALGSASTHAAGGSGPGRPLQPLPAPSTNAPTVAAPNEQRPSSWADHIKLAGGIALYYYQPTNGWENMFIAYANLRFDARYEPFGVHFQPRFSSEKMRVYYDGLAWIQEAYVFFEAKPVKLKVGKIYKQLGLFWDNTFYGNIHVYEGLKFDPNSGFALEGNLGEEAGLSFHAQFFVTDGHTNASLLGRDTISIPGARRRNIAVARVQPFFQLSPKARLELGFSGEHFDAELPQASNSVWRAAVDAKLTVGGFGMWGEALHQSGKNVTDFPYAGDPTSEPAVPGRASGDNTYLLAGVEYTQGPVTARYNLSIARYSEVMVQEVLHLPGVGVTFNEHVSFLFEYALWDRFAREGRSDVDRSLNFTWMGRL